MIEPITLTCQLRILKIYVDGGLPLSDAIDKSISVIELAIKESCLEEACPDVKVVFRLAENLATEEMEQNRHQQMNIKVI